MSARHYLLLALLLAGAGHAMACPQKIPTGMSAVIVGEDVVVNGMKMQMLQVEGKQKVAPTFDQVEKEWTEAGYLVKRSQAEGWNVLAALSEKCLTTLQLVDKGGSFGYLAVNKLDKYAKVRQPKVPLPPGAKVLSTVQSDDDGRKGSTMALAVSQSVQQLTEFYLKRLRDDDWSGVQAQALMGKDRALAGSTVTGQRGRDRIEVVIVRDGDVKVVINMAAAL